MKKEIKLLCETIFDDIYNIEDNKNIDTDIVDQYFSNKIFGFNEFKEFLYKNTTKYGNFIKQKYSDKWDFRSHCCYDLEGRNQMLLFIWYSDGLYSSRAEATAIRISKEKNNEMFIDLLHIIDLKKKDRSSSYVFNSDHPSHALCWQTPYKVTEQFAYKFIDFLNKLFNIGVWYKRDEFIENFDNECKNNKLYL